MIALDLESEVSGCMPTRYDADVRMNCALDSLLRISEWKWRGTPESLQRHRYWPGTKMRFGTRNIDVEHSVKLAPNKPGQDSIATNVLKITLAGSSGTFAIEAKRREGTKNWEFKILEHDGHGWTIGPRSAMLRNAESTNPIGDLLETCTGD